MREIRSSVGEITYEQPFIGPHGILARGPSGWMEHWKRPRADRALEAAIKGRMTLEQAFLRYATMRKGHTNEEPWAWSHVKAVVAQITGVGVANITDELVVILWALAEDALEKTPTLGSNLLPNPAIAGRGKQVIADALIDVEDADDAPLVLPPPPARVRRLPQLTGERNEW